jgi:hypothetical protein
VAVVLDPVWTGDWRLMALWWERRSGAYVPDMLAKGMAGVAAISDHPHWYAG